MVWPLVGRERELETVVALLGASGGAVVAGPAGVGKTRLARELAEVAGARGWAVEWVRATRSAATIPLGAFAALLPAGGEGVELLARARRALGERAEGRRLVLCVDDGHLLDDASAALVHQLAAAREAFAVVTLRRGERTPDALQALWKDELCAFVELGELERARVQELLAHALGGPLDGLSLAALWQLTRGNALFLRELVLYGVDQGMLADDGGVWRWRGELAVGTRLAELVGARLAGLADAQRAVLETVAVGAPLEAAAVEDARALEELERREIVERRADGGRRRLVDVAHPLHGEVVRAALSPTRLETIQRALAEGVEAHGARRRTDAPRLATWRLEAGGGDRELFERAAAHALSALDFPAAERFARAAGDGLALGRALAGAGRAREADDVLRALRPESDEQRAAIAVATARNLFWALDGAAAADALLVAAGAAVSSAAPRAELLAQRVRLLAASGLPGEALATATALLADEEVREPARLHAAAAAAEALLSLGRCAEAVALTEAWEPVARRHREEVPLFEGLLRSERAMALRFAGRLAEAAALAEENYARALEQRSAQTAAVEASSLGYVWLARGRPRTALRLLRECASQLRDADPVGMLAWALAGIAQAAAQAGDAAEAGEALAEMEARPLGHKGFESERGLARAWSAAAAGELTRARALARATADAASERGQHAYAVRALHDLARLGEPDAAALHELAASVDGPFAPAAAAHAAARDGEALLEAAERLAELDMLLAAAEAAQAAARAFADEGRAASAATAAARAGTWLRRCEGARPPTLLEGATAELTEREREIALLAAGGLSSRDIAGRLVVSVRTVDNHLQRAYRKLGVAGRGDLADALQGE